MGTHFNLLAEEVVGDALVKTSSVGAQQRNGEGRDLHIDLLQGMLEGHDLAIDEQRGVTVVFGIIEGDFDDVARIGDDGA